jgi:hypothetical protein
MSEPKALANAAKFTAAGVRISGARGQFRGTHNRLILLIILKDSFLLRVADKARSFGPLNEVDDIRSFPDFAERNAVHNRSANIFREGPMQWWRPVSAIAGRCRFII